MLCLKEIYDEQKNTLILPRVSNRDDNELLAYIAEKLARHFSSVTRAAAPPLYFLRDAFFLSVDGHYLFNSLADNIPTERISDDPDFPNITPPVGIFKKRLALQKKLAEQAFYRDSMPDMLQEKKSIYDTSHGHISPYYIKDGRGFLAQISPASVFKSLPIPGGNIIPLTKQDGTQIILAGVNSEFLWQAAQTVKPSLPPLDTYLLPLGWQRDKNLFFIPQSSYHIDLTIAAPKPGVVIVNTYEPLLRDDRAMSSLLEKIKRCFPIDLQILPKIPQQKFIFEYQQRCLDTVAKFLQDQGFTVIRALGHLGFAGYQDGPVRSARIEAVSVFNFINGIPKRRADGGYEFVGLGTYPDLRSFQDEFRAALAKENITCHFLSEDDPSGQIANLYHDLHAGLRCFSMLAPRVGGGHVAQAAAASAGASAGSTNPCAAGCGKPGTAACGRCNAVHYCSRDCQKAHWPKHKLVCMEKPTGKPQG